MGFTSIDKKREYQRKWVADRRKHYLKGKICCRCHSTKDIEIHHMIRESKTSHKIWSWSKDKIAAELQKCIFICKQCHVDLHRELALTKRIHGDSHTYKNGCRCPACREAHKLCAREYTQGRNIRISLTPQEVAIFNKNFDLEAYNMQLLQVKNK
jgi:hypothetical protein